MKKEKQIPTDEQIKTAFAGTNFGPNPDFVSIAKNGLLSVVVGYHNGYTLTQVLKSLGLITIRPVFGGSTVKVTDLGRRACYDWFKKKESVVAQSEAV